jgi:microcystin-dependent protein
MSATKIIADFRTSLATKLAVGGTSFTLQSATDDDGVALPAGKYYFTCDGENSQKEHFYCDLSGANATNVQSVSRQGVKTSGAVREHRVGATITITDFAHIKDLADFVDQFDGKWENAVANYTALLAVSSPEDGEVRVTLDDSKIYVYDLDTTTWNLAGAGGGAGTVYRTTLLGTESTGDDNKTFTLTSGSFPDKKYFQVYKNGVLMGEGATNDYVATGSNQAVFNEAVLDDDVIDLLVISVDLYNPAWNQVNGDILPDITETHDIGSTTKKFKDLHLSGDVYAERFIGAIPAGCIMPYAGATAPTGWLIADGSAVSRTTYADLFAVVGETYGAGDGSTTFNVPDLRGKIPVGKSTETEFNTLGKTGGEKTHQLTVEELAAHTHSIQAYAPGGGGNPQGIQAVSTPYVSYVGSTGSIGSDTPHNNLQPYITLNYIIKY